MLLVELFHFPGTDASRPTDRRFIPLQRRAWPPLGDGPIEEAIQRRLNHLRSGKAHIRESEKEDGTVLEIRGNSLPEGGFVTSYTDITSYKNATRELRLLADTLEHRVAERTHDLATKHALKPRMPIVIKPVSSPQQYTIYCNHSMQHACL